MSSKIYEQDEAAQRLYLPKSTLQRLDETGCFAAERTPSGRKFYTESQLTEFGDGLHCDMNIDNKGFIDRGFVLEYVNHVNKNKTAAMNMKLVRGTPCSEKDGMAKEVIGHNLDFKVNGIDIGESIIYNALLDFVLYELNYNKADVLENVVPMIKTHREADNVNKCKTEVSKIVCRYIIKMLMNFADEQWWTI